MNKIKKKKKKTTKKTKKKLRFFGIGAIVQTRDKGLQYDRSNEISEEVDTNKRLWETRTMKSMNG